MADTAAMTPLSVTDALSLLFGGGRAELEGDGCVVTVSTVRVDEHVITATAPRLSVAEGMELTGRVIGPDGQPWAIGLTIEVAEYHSADLALVRMAVAGIEVDTSRRAAARVPIGGVAWLEAVSCQDVVDGDRVEGTLEDLSSTGVAFTTRRVLRVNDRLIFHGRFFADSIRGEIRVASVRKASAPGQTIVGGRFIELDEESEGKIAAILAGGQGPTAPPRPDLDMNALRQAVGDHEPQPEPQRGWFGRRRRD